LSGKFAAQHSHAAPLFMSNPKNQQEQIEPAALRIRAGVARKTRGSVPAVPFN
jgi:hypothetical protein